MLVGPLGCLGGSFGLWFSQPFCAPHTAPLVAGKGEVLPTKGSCSEGHLCTNRAPGWKQKTYNCEGWHWEGRAGHWEGRGWALGGKGLGTGREGAGHWEGRAGEGLGTGTWQGESMLT